MEKIIEIYNNKLAEQYDEATLKGKWSAPNETNKLLSQFGLVKNNLTVLDLGIGTGQSIKSFTNKNCEIYAVDISNKMLRIVRKKYPEAKTFKYDISKGLSGLRLKDNFFDIVIAVGVLEFINNIKRIIKETYQLLKTDGYFIFTYELLLPNHKLQKLRVQYNAEGYIENPPNITKFKLYRRSKKEINEILSNTGYQIIRHFKIRAFLKGPTKIPVYYGVVLTKKK
ncbi:MAG: class I SAM-dependent methyltransferase [Minisyncoccales bacterium]